MASEILEPGYEDFRELAADRWTHLAVRSGGRELFRLDTGDDRVMRFVEPPYVRYQVRLAASDPEIDAVMPITIDEIALAETPAGPTVRSPGPFEPFTFEDPADAVTITHSLKIPTEALEGPPGPPGKDGHSVHIFQQHHDPGASAAPGDFWIDIP